MLKNEQYVQLVYLDPIQIKYTGNISNQFWKLKKQQKTKKKN